MKYNDRVRFISGFYEGYGGVLYGKSDSTYYVYHQDGQLVSVTPEEIQIINE